jgi:hypothetical protein
MRALYYILFLILLQTQAHASGLVTELNGLKAENYRRAMQLEQALAQALPSEVEVLRDDYLEARARTDLLDRIIFYTDTHFKGGDEREFLKRASLALAEREVKMPEVGQGKLWLFLRNLSQVLDKSREAGQTPTVVLSAYMNFSSVLSPKEPKEFLKNMDYSNGLITESVANTLTKETVASAVERELNRPTIKAPLSAPKPRPVVVTE